jgi:7,8-dihydropterin-6-yl-methyl-4-(beta-D-ribofuranosyl)aminobenzene 5'-phosphate synthase
MCDGDGPAQVRRAAPRAAPGEAVDPITLEPVDELVVTVLVDNSYDGLMPDTACARRAHLSRLPTDTAPQFAELRTYPGLVAEHGFSALVTTRRAGNTHTLLLDTGISPDGLATNVQRLGVDVGSIEALVLSHGHFDHAGGLVGLSRLRAGRALPLVLHPLVWTRRRFAVPGQPAWDLPTLSRSGVEAEGFTVVERRQPSVVLDSSVLLTGEVDRTTDFEHGLPFHEAQHDGGWELDPLVLDDQALVVHVRGQGLVVITGCGHAGAVNIVRHALRLTGVDRLHAVLGGFHLGGPAFEPVIEPTVAAFAELAPDVVVPAHCSGWKAQQRFAAALPHSFVPAAVGTAYTFAAAPVPHHEPAPER